MMKKVLDPGCVVLLQHGRIVEPRMAAEAVAALSACVGWHLTYLLSSLLGAARGTSAMNVLTSASTGSSCKPFISTELIRDHRRVLSLLVTGVKVRSADVAAVMGERIFDWDHAIRVCGFSVWAGPDGGYGSVVAPPLVLFDAVQSYKHIIGASAGAAAGAPVDLTEMKTNNCSCLGDLSSALVACEAGGSPDQSAELHHYWWAVDASRARADLATSASRVRGLGAIRAQAGGALACPLSAPRPATHTITLPPHAGPQSTHRHDPTPPRFTACRPTPRHRGEHASRPPAVAVAPPGASSLHWPRC